MAHKFNPDNKDNLKSDKRRFKLPPKDLLVKFGLGEGDILADVGCGTGHFSIPASQIVGNRGKIYALDISEKMLATLEEAVSQQSINNLETIVSEENDLKLDDEVATFALLSMVLHEAENLMGFLSEVSRILQPGGKIAVIDWKPKQTQGGPPVDHRLARETVEEYLTEAGFVGAKSSDFSDKFYTISARKY